ncbi:hypothetical protein AM493_04785 [Flavobacterium akiainvivens]|uniref:N-acetyltransferase domain-containing protein n=1 Tax=Flavobacterium akiainvivens TaxID=1202724 RepID=A0A0M8MFW9_9FLAO|nr:hypothetical protein [Flavobacterium akiainvivens]KOS05421.1 hypothetical protein AM493_04785 [Flavobacterium akiainvivens]SFQ78166.1 hypothetical protein SAMN05444144_1295 [Flavobacterium akiainvivens]
MQTVTHIKEASEIDVVIERVREEDFKKMTKARFFFNWKTEKENEVYKLTLAGTDEILGVMSLVNYPGEQRCQINLLSVSKENRGKNKIYAGIAGNLIAYACRESIKLYGADACVSLHPKTELKAHYIEQYGMMDAGMQVFVEGINLFRLLEKYKI